MYFVTCMGVLLKFLVVSAMPENVINFQRAAEKFQESVQQQTFQSVLNAIEDRLRNLDNIYTMQLSETLKSKLDQYSRKLDFLDTKLIRLESMVMLNLNHISENISSKNYKDDLTKTQIYKKIETYYEGLSHRMNYVDRKIEIGFDKLQNKADSTLHRLERMEEDMIQRNSDIESELSETLSTLEEFRGSTVKTDKILSNMTNALELSVQSARNIGTVNNMLSSLTKRFDALENNTLIPDLKRELKSDFNSYANKVSDMNMEQWQRNDVTKGQLKIMETAVNATRVEVQNGMRALMVQIGKSSGKAIPANGRNPEESWQKYVNISLEKLLLNQDLFLESCHRVQMDESQIESEISQTLGKLIDMLETKMTTVMRDLKSLDKTVKTHDSKAHRNLNQANTNIVSLFEKSVLANENTAKDLQDIKFYINSLFTYLQEVLPKRRGRKVEDILSEVSSNVSTMINLFNNWTQQIKSQPPAIANLTEIMPTFTKHLNLSGDMHKTLKEIKISIMDLQHHLKRDSNSTGKNMELPKRKCAQNYKHLIDVRGDFTECNDTADGENIEDHEKNILQEPLSTTEATNQEDLSQTLTEIFGTPPPIKKCPQNYRDLIDIRGDFSHCNDTVEDPSAHQDPETPIFQEASSTTTEKLDTSADLSKTLLEIFGTPPPPTEQNTKFLLGVPSTTEKSHAKKKDCIPEWANMINVRTGAANEQKSQNCTTKVKKNKTKKKRKQNKRPVFTSRFNLDQDEDDDQNVEIAEIDEYEDVSTEMDTENILFTESSTEVSGIDSIDTNTGKQKQ